MAIVKYVVKKLALLVPVLVGISIIAFALGTMAPGDPVEQYLNPDGNTVYSQEEYDAARHKLGLDQPAAIQYLVWIRNLMKGDLGRSFFTQKTILSQLQKRIPVSIRLAMYSMALTLLFGIGFGVLMALFQDTWIDRALSGLATVALSVPGFWVAIVLIYLFAETWKILPTSGITQSRGYILPAVTMSLSSIGVCSRLTRTSILDELSRQYVTVASAKGMRRRRTVICHALCNAMIPVVTYLGTHLAGILGGASIVETIFSIPGIGSYAITAVQSKDYLVVQAYVLFSGTVYVAANILIDLMYLLINPKIRAGEGTRI